MPDVRAEPTDSVHPFEGPLAELWGRRMREPRLRALFADAGAAELRRRSGIPDAADRAIWGDVDPVTLEHLGADAELERGGPWADATASLFARFVRDGDRTQYEAAVDARQHRLTRAVVLAAVTGSDDWIDEAADGVVVLCEQSTWSLPAHDDAHERRGFVVPDAAAPYLDLAAGETVAQLAVADRVLGAGWDTRWPGLRDRIRHEAELRVFTPFQTRDDFWWLGYRREVNNWNPWILGNVVLAAVLLLDDTARVAAITARALDSLDRYVATLPADGAIDEGVAYWWNGAGRMLELLGLVSRLTAGELEAAALPLVREVLRFPMRMQLGGEWYVNVADGWARSRHGEPWQLAFDWGRRTGDRQVADWARGARRPDRPVAPVKGGLPRLVRALADREWRDATTAPPPLPRTVWLPSVQVLVCRPRAGDTAGITLAAKGGTNGESHNHKDLGSFLVAAGGRPLLVDIGKPTYTRQTFSAERYGIRAMQSGWHNVPAPHGMEQGEGTAFAARVLRPPTAGPGRPATAGEHLPDDGEPIALELDLTGAYPLGPGERWRRSFRLEPDGRVRVTDEWRLDAAGGGADDGAVAALHLIAAGEARVEGDRILVTADGRGIAITVGGLLPELDVWRLDDPELSGVWGPELTRLRYDILPASGRVTTMVEELR